MRERLQKILSARGVCSRRRAEELIAAGRVTCNGVTAAPGDCADTETDRILVDGKPLPSAAPPVYILLNKPRGYVTTLSDEKGRPNAAELVAGCGRRVYPVGRLDLNSEGLLLMTNDGALANRLMHPSAAVEKEYLVWLSGYYAGCEETLRKPIEIDGRKTTPAEVRLVKAEGPIALLRVTIHEGRNRQIRRLCEQANVTVTRLRRIREGALLLGDLGVGQWRPLTGQELKLLGV